MSAARIPTVVARYCPDLVTKAERQALAGTRVTLNGQPAIVSGSASPFATVTQLGSGLSAEWSWSAVRRVVARGGDFR